MCISLPHLYDFSDPQPLSPCEFHSESLFPVAKFQSLSILVGWFIDKSWGKVKGSLDLKNVFVFLKYIYSLLTILIVNKIIITDNMYSFLPFLNCL